MYKRVKRAKLGRKQSHRNSLRRNLLRSLFKNSNIVTTSQKAKVLKQDASSLISKGVSKKGSLEFRRKLEEVFGDKELIKKFNEYIVKEDIGVKLVKVGFRSGDNAEKSRVVLKGTEKKKKVVKKEKEEEKKEKVSETKNVSSFEREKRVDKTAVIKKTGRSNTRSGL